MRIHDIIESLQLYEAPIGQAISKGVAPGKEIPPTASTTAPIGQPVNFAKSFTAGQKSMNHILSPSTWFGDPYADAKFSNAEKRQTLNKISNKSPRDAKDAAILESIPKDIAKNPEIGKETKKALLDIFKEINDNPDYTPTPPEKDALYAYNKAYLN